MFNSNKKMNNVKYIHNITATTYKEHFGEEWDNKKHLDKFLELLNKNNINPKVLELGCGWGYHTDYLRRNGVDAVGIDFSKKFLKIAKKEFPFSKFKKINALSLTKHYKESSVDGIFGIYFFYFIPKEETENLWKNISTVLKSGGLVFGITTMGDSNEQMVPTSCLPVDDNRRLYMYNFSEQRWKELIISHGFKIVYWEKLSKVEKEIIGADKKIAFIIQKIGGII